MQLFEKEEWPVFLKHPTQWMFLKVDGKEKAVFSMRVELTDNQQGFIHQRKKKVYKDDADFGSALDLLINYEVVNSRDYLIGLRDYFKKETDAAERFEPIYNKLMDQYWQNRNI